MTNTHAIELDRRGEYGFDACLPAAVGVVTVGAALVAAGIFLFARREHPAAGLAMLVVGAFVLVNMGIYLHTTRRGKFAVWAELLRSFDLRGDERVLDVGCGRGAVLTMIAKRVPRGRAVGLNLWTLDQSGNEAGATARNLEAEGVRERCEIVTADMRSMPFPDASFDVIVSSIAIHNIAGSAERLRAIDEIARVLKPGGRLLIADLAWTASYAERLREHGLQDVQRRGLGWRFWWGPGYPATTALTARKAAGPAGQDPSRFSACSRRGQ